MAFQNKSFITKTHLQSFWTNLKSKLPTIDSPIVNYVIEQGETGGWTYRKWSDGYCEAWYHFWQTNMSVDTNRWAYPTVSIPQGLFTKWLDCVYAGGAMSDDTGCQVGGCDWTTTQWNGHFKSSSANTTRNIEANLYAVGWWR